MANDAKKENEKVESQESKKDEKLHQILNKFEEAFKETDEFLKDAETHHLALLGIMVLLRAKDLSNKIDLLMHRDPKFLEAEAKCNAAASQEK